jgi:perosamine synthetase
VMHMKINYAGPHIDHTDAEFVKNAVLNGFYENYKKYTQELESLLCEYLGVQHAVAVSSCTAALHLGLAALGIGKGDEVITTDASCVASAMPIIMTGATPVLVDVEPGTWCIDPDAVRRAVNKRTKAIIPVHWNGHPADMAAICSIAQEHGLKVLEDGAPSLGAEISGRKVGTFGDAACFSFQGAKIAIGGQGGALVTNDSNLYERARILSQLGRTDSVKQYWSDYVGWNYTMANVVAALVVSQMARADELLARKKRIFESYSRGLQTCAKVRLITPSENTTSTYCYPAVELSQRAAIDRDTLLDRLRSNQIDARPAQPRISGMPMFESRFSNPVATVVENQGIILPSAFNLNDSDIAFVCECITKEI